MKILLLLIPILLLSGCGVTISENKPNSEEYTNTTVIYTAGNTLTLNKSSNKHFVIINGDNREVLDLKMSNILYEDLSEEERGEKILFLGKVISELIKSEL